MAKKSKKEVELEVEEPSEEQEVAIFSEEDLENSGLRELVDKGKEQGFLTYEEINAMLPEDISDPDQVEETIQMLIDIGVEVQERAQAEELGFVEDSWPTQPPNWVEWDNLGESQLAAEGLGFTEELWKGLQFEVGETVDRRNEGSPWMQCIVTNIIPLLVTISSSGDGEGIRWADVKKKQTQRSPVPSTLGYEKSWENLNAQERLGAQALDWDETTWESGIAPPNYVEWEGLSADKITAAEDLGFT